MSKDKRLNSDRLNQFHNGMMDFLQILCSKLIKIRNSMDDEVKVFSEIEKISMILQVYEKKDKSNRKKKKSKKAKKYGNKQYLTLENALSTGSRNKPAHSSKNVLKVSTKGSAPTPVGLAAHKTLDSPTMFRNPKLVFDESPTGISLRKKPIVEESPCDESE